MENSLSVICEIRRVDRISLVPFIEQAEREGLVFCSKTEYYGAFVRGAMVGFSGLLLYRNKAVFKNAWVQPVWRRRGIFRQLFSFIIGKARELGLPVMEATCTPMSLPHFKAMGAEVVLVYQNGCQKVRLQL